MIHKKIEYEKYLKAEEISMKKFEEYQRKQIEIDLAKAKERIRIQLEYDKEQKRIENLNNERKRLAEESKKQYERLVEKIELYIKGKGEVPNELTNTAETNPGKPLCQFFTKTSSCRFGDRCSRNHSRPGISNQILIPNFFTHIQLEQNKATEYGNDLYLEYEDSDMYISFVEFFHDISMEFEKYGKICNLFVCTNYEPHLRGNVYIEYERQRFKLKSKHNPLKKKI